jgi:hypothetical protein
MAWRIHEYVVRGTVDNRRRGKITGRIWLSGIEQPLELDLTGDCQPDLAGCLLNFENPTPVEMTTKPPVSRQRGTPGFITAARKVRVFDGGIEAAFAALKRGEQPPEHMANSIRIEWYSAVSGEVIIESADYRLKISQPTWRFTEAEIAEAQRRQSENNTEFDAAIEADGTLEKWDEVRYEQSLRESDALTERYGRLLDKYGDDPNAERLIAREMGWTWLEEALSEEKTEDEDDEGVIVEPISEDGDSGGDIDTDDLRVSHPIKIRADVALHALLDELKANGSFPNCDDEDLGNFVGGYMTVTAKLAGALGGFERDLDYESGLVIAWLKRILEILNDTLAAADRVAGKPFLTAERLNHYRTELFGIREDVLALINELRAG